MKKALIIAGALIPVIVVLVAMTRTRAVEPSEVIEQKNASVEIVEKQPFAVEGVEVSRGKLVGMVQVSGIVEGSTEAYVVAEFGGTISSLDVELGAYVSAGDPLVVLADKGEQSTLEQVAAQLENAEREFEATEKLFARGSASEADFTRARSSLKGLEAAYKRAVDATEARILSTPISGFIADLNPAATVGNMLNPGTRVATVVDLSALKLRASLGERQMALVDRGAAAMIDYTMAADLPASQARIKAVAAGADPSTGAYRIVLEWPNEHGVTRSGMTATATITTNEDLQLLVPASALVTRNGVTGGFIAADGVAQFREIETGKRFGDSVIAASGVVEGDVILVSGTTTLVDNDPVVISIIGTSGGNE